MRWLESGGGPLILVPRRHLLNWTGIQAPDGGGSDYDRACEVTDEVALITVGEKGTGLVFGDEPFRTAWFADESGGLVIRWVYADSEAAVAEYLKNASLGEVLEDTRLSFATPGDCLLFDSAEPGSDVRGDSIDIALHPGTYRIRSAIVNPSDEMRLVLHQLAVRT